MSTCVHDFACDCDEHDDPRVQGAWQDFDEAHGRASARRDAHDVTDRPSHTPRGPEMGHQQHADRPLQVRVLHPHIEQPSDRERREHAQARDERRCRADLYPVGEVIALPRRCPINDDGPGLHPEAA